MTNHVWLSHLEGQLDHNVCIYKLHLYLHYSFIRMLHYLWRFNCSSHLYLLHLYCFFHTYLYLYTIYCCNYSIPTHVCSQLGWNITSTGINGMNGIPAADLGTRPALTFSPQFWVMDFTRWRKGDVLEIWWCRSDRNIWTWYWCKMRWEVCAC